MGHNVQAFVGPRDRLERILDRYGHSTIVDLVEGVALLPLTGDLHDALEWNPGDSYDSEASFMLLSAKIKRVLAAAADERGLVYFETDYAGGHGTQGAIVARSGVIVFGPASGAGSINTALSLLGVRATAAGTDEFEQAGLNRCRRNEDWLELADG